MNFNLSKTSAKLNSFNIRAERHGDNPVPAGDLKLTITAANTILDEFDPKLREALYQNTQADQGQKDVEGVAPTLPNLRFPNLEGPFKFTDEGAGYKLTLDYGVGGERSNVTIEGCQVNNFSADCLEGGTVELSFRVQMTDPSADLIGKLGVQVQHEIVIDLEAPVVAAPATVTPIKGRQKKMTKDETQAALQKAFLDGEDAKDAKPAGDPPADGTTEPWPFPKTGKP